MSPLAVALILGIPGHVGGRGEVQGLWMQQGAKRNSLRENSKWDGGMTSQVSTCQESGCVPSRVRVWPCGRREFITWVFTCGCLQLVALLEPKTRDGFPHVSGSLPACWLGQIISPWCGLASFCKLNQLPFMGECTPRRQSQKLHSLWRPVSQNSDITAAIFKVKAESQGQPAGNEVKE